MCKTGSSRLIFFLLAAIMLSCGLFSCRIQENGSPPVILPERPLSGSAYNVTDTIYVKATVTDDSPLLYIKVVLNDNQNRPVLTPIILQSPKNPSVLNLAYPIDDPALETGEYELNIQASDGENTSNTFIRISITGIEKEFQGTILVTRPASNLIRAWTYHDSTGFREVISYQGDYAGSALNSTHKLLYLSGSSQSDLIAVSLNNNQIAWQIPVVMQPSNRWFESVAYQSPYLLVSYNEGYVKGFDHKGVTVFTTSDTDPEYPLLATLSENGLVACLQNRKTGTCALDLFYVPGGTIMTRVSPVPRAVALLPATSHEMLLFGNQDQSARIDVFNDQNRTLSNLKTLPNDSIFSVAAMDADNYLLSGLSGIYWYRYSTNSIVTFTDEMPRARIKCETVGMEVYAALGNAVRIYSFPEALLKKTISSPDPILDIHLLYNK